MLVLAHAARPDALVAAKEVCEQLRRAGLTPVIAPTGHPLRAEVGGVVATLEKVSIDKIELTIVLGGDGTILGAAELTRGSAAPLLGINHGHVGFLAESEKDDLAWTVATALAGDYVVEERLVLDVSVRRGEEELFHTFAINEATIEKASRARMIEVGLEIDGRPISTFGADGVVMATPTGSTAYSFSAGGPIVWPGVEALLMVPLSAHALFARPLVVGPDSAMAVEVLERSASPAILWCDGRRGVEIAPGSRVIATKSDTPIRLARLHPGPFTDRLVRKFSLPVTGWRGPVEE
jgi:NAD+ kinase|tara:strand:+ start:3605 stop:4486 length:882 start_codon:yes stop_codon:yes gene_type:complete